jgi:hypothetical protein
MNESRADYITATANAPVKVTYTDDAPDVRDYLVNLRRDLLRKVRDLDELIARIDPVKPRT